LLWVLFLSKTFIHVGLHKTATTYLQSNIWPSLSNITCLTRPYTQHNNAFNQLQYADDSLYDAKLFDNEVEQFNGKNILISDESLSGKPLSFSCINRTQIAKRLQQQFPDAEIILFLRNQPDIIRSHYSSYIRMPFGVKKFNDFIYKPINDFSYEDSLAQPDKYDMSSLYYNTNDIFLHMDCFKYYPLVKMYRELFNKCHIFLYEDFKENSAKCLSQLGSIFGQDIKPLSVKIKNRALTTRQLESRRKANIINYSLKNKYLKKGLLELFRLRNKNVAIAPVDEVDLFTNGYFSSDNQLLKELLPELNWSCHSGKYV